MRFLLSFTVLLFLEIDCFSTGLFPSRTTPPRPYAAAHIGGGGGGHRVVTDERVPTVHTAKR